MLASPAGEDFDIALKQLSESEFYKSSDRGVTYYRRNDSAESIFNFNYDFREFVKPALNYRLFEAQTQGMSEFLVDTTGAIINDFLEDQQAQSEKIALYMNQYSVVAYKLDGK